MITFQNLDLLSVSIVVAATAVMGFAVFFSNRQSITNRSFLIFSLITLFWGTVNYLFYNVSNPDLSLWLLRLVLFFAIWQALTIFQLLFVFPSSRVVFPRWYKYGLIPLVTLTSILTLTPLAIERVKELSHEGRILAAYNGPAMPLFGFLGVLLVIGSLYYLFRKIWLTPKNERKPYWLILTGVSITFAFVIVFSLILPSTFDDSRFVSLGALFFFPFIAFTSYAILRHHLFSVRAMWAGVLVFLLSVTAFFEVIFAGEIGLVLYRGAVFLLLLFFGILLIKGIIRETKQREEIQKLAARLKSVNSILAHDVKGTMAKGRDAFSLLLDGTYGFMPEKAKPLLKDMMKDMNKMLNAIVNILAAGREMTLTVKQFDLKAAVLEVVRDAAKDAAEKHLTIKTVIPRGDYTITADKTQLVTHVLRNLIENAVNYNIENGFITVSLASQDPKKFLLTVKDTGVGIKDEDKPNMFKEGGRGKESSKINVHSSGYGLATAKKTAEAHGGRIWFESKGVPGKGATFFVELPVVAKIT